MRRRRARSAANPGTYTTQCDRYRIRGEPAVFITTGLAAQLSSRRTPARSPRPEPRSTLSRSSSSAIRKATRSRGAECRDRSDLEWRRNPGRHDDCYRATTLARCHSPISSSPGRPVFGRSSSPPTRSPPRSPRPSRSESGRPPRSKASMERDRPARWGVGLPVLPAVAGEGRERQPCRRLPGELRREIRWRKRFRWKPDYRR